LGYEQRKSALLKLSRRNKNKDFVFYYQDAPTETKVIRKRMKVKNSLSSTLKSAGIPKKIVQNYLHHLSYTMDFQRDVRNGDLIELLYEANFTKSNVIIGNPQLLYGLVHLRDHKLELFRYKLQNGKIDYFDANGKSIFAGFKASTSAFNKRLDGTVEYVGDRGNHALQVSENMKVVSGLDGGTVFGSIKTDFGRKSIFEILENSINAAKTASQVTSQGTAPAKAELELAVSRNPQNWSFDLEGSEGKININMNLSQASISNLKDQINLHTDKTGIIATYDETTKKITLSEKYAGSIVISNLEIEGVDNATREPEFYFNMESIDGEGNKIGYPRQIVDKDQVMSTSVGDIKKSINHISNQLAFIGAQTRKTDQQLNFLGERLTIVTGEVSELGDADLTKLVTDLQATIVNRDAAQAAFVKIGQQSLFDFLR